MKNFLLLLLFISSWNEMCSQNVFNRVHPLSCQDFPLNFAANSSINDIFIIDRQNDFYDGYLLFGSGVVCHPSVCANYTRVFSMKCNVDGELITCQRYDNDSIDINSSYGSFSYNPMAINHRQNFIGIKTEYSSFDVFDSESVEYLVEYNWIGFEISKIVVDSSDLGYYPYNIVENLEDSTYAVCGAFRDSISYADNIEPDGYLMKLDTLGNKLWERTYNNTFAISRVICDTNGYWLIGEEHVGDCTFSSELNYNCIVLHTNPLGMEQDRYILDGACGFEYAQILDSESGFILAGMLTDEEIEQPCDVAAGKFYSSHIGYNELSQQIELVGNWKQYNHWCPGERFSDFQKCVDGGFAIVGDYAVAPLPYVKGLIFKLDENLDSLWLKSYLYYDQGDNFTRHYIRAFQSAPDSGFVCAGYIHQGYDGVPNPDLDVPWIFKTDKFGCLEPGCQLVAVNEIVIGLENTMTVFPNPIQSECTVAFKLENVAKLQSDFGGTQLVVTDISGKEMHRQSLNQLSANQKVVIPMNEYSSGIYFVHWISGGTWLDSVKVVKE